jgi:hypothetical protein
MPPKLNRGIDATVSIPLKFLHPSEYIREKFPNFTNAQKLDNCTVLRREQKCIRRRQQLAIIVSHESFPGKELHCADRYAKVTKEGPPEKFFEKNTARSSSDVQPASIAPRPADEQQEMPSICFRNFRDDDPDLRAAAEAGLLEVDDDNEPVPENIPVQGVNQTTNECQYNPQWGHAGVCFRRQIGSCNRKAKLKNHDQHIILTKLQLLFEVIFPTAWVEEVLILPGTNKSLDVFMAYGEFLQFIGIWLHICTTVGFECRDFWSKPKTQGHDTPFNSMISCESTALSQSL